MWRKLFLKTRPDEAHQDFSQSFSKLVGHQLELQLNDPINLKVQIKQKIYPP